MSSSIPPPPPHYSSFPTTSTSNSGPYFLTRAKTTTQSVFATRRPWEEIFALSSFIRPYSLGEATVRIKHNLNHFRVNYAMMVLFILFLSLLWHPFSMIVFLVAFVAWFFLYFSRNDPVAVFHRTIDDRVMLGVLAAVTVIALILTGVWLNVLVSILIGIVFVVVHAAFRSTEDLYVDDNEDFDGGLISVVESPPTNRAGYNRI